jgi:hypothetical protein
MTIVSTDPAIRPSVIPATRSRARQRVDPGASWLASVGKPDSRPRLRRGAIVAYPMGESRLEPLRVDFDRRIKLEFHGARITSDRGLLAYGELDDAFGLTDASISARNRELLNLPVISRLPRQKSIVS